MRDPQLQPIETEWNGYRFRSRLEARWAVFFDTLSVPYQYEVQGYRIDGVPYLPDFWLPKQDCWFEVKPEYPGDAYRQMLKRLAVLSGKPMVFTSSSDFSAPTLGTDDDEAIRGAWLRVLDPKSYPPEHGSDEGWHAAWSRCSICEDDDLSDGYLGIPELPSWGDHRQRIHPGREEHWQHNAPAILDAYRAARQARFEHGERRWPR